MGIVDLEFIDKPYTKAQLYGLIYGVSIVDTESRDGYCDVSCVSWYQKRAASIDGGNISAMSDVIQFEGLVETIPDITTRAAVYLSMLGWAPEEVGSVLRSSKPGRHLVSEGVRYMLLEQRLRTGE